MIEQLSFAEKIHFVISVECADKLGHRRVFIEIGISGYHNSSDKFFMQTVKPHCLIRLRLSKNQRSINTAAFEMKTLGKILMEFIIFDIAGALIIHIDRQRRQCSVTCDAFYDGRANAGGRSKVETNFAAFPAHFSRMGS